MSLKNRHYTECEDFNFLVDIYAVRGEAKCWNCDKTGHNYYDCLDVRRVFCFGCGATDTYRPSCLKCSEKSRTKGCSTDLSRTSVSDSLDISNSNTGSTLHTITKSDTNTMNNIHL